MRWLYHLVDAREAPSSRYAPPSLAREGFIHCSWVDALEGTAAKWFAPDAPLVAWRIDPRRLDVPVVVADTPRGPMPHVHGSLPADAVREVMPHARWADAPDRVTGHRVAFVAFEGTTLLDLVGPLDAVSRLRSMGFDATVVTDIVGAHNRTVWRGDGAVLSVEKLRPALTDYDLVVVPGGLGARALAEDETVLAWLRARPSHHAWASVCTGSLVLAAAGILTGRRATTHHSALDLLAAYEGVTVVRERVVHDGPVRTAAGVTAGLDLGVALTAWLGDEPTARAISTQMEHSFAL